MVLPAAGEWICEIYEALDTGRGKDGQTCWLCHSLLAGGLPLISDVGYRPASHIIANETHLRCMFGIAGGAMRKTLSGC